MPNKHDELLLKDLNLQPRWLLYLYIVLGLIAAIVGWGANQVALAKISCLGGGFLIALGAEKLVTYRLRKIALKLIQPKD
jgi:hypothetical protein